MALAIVYSRAQVGVEAPAVMVEAHLANGLPALTLVGLPEAALYELYNRILFLLQGSTNDCSYIQLQKDF